jgi:hypothetical protein
MVWERLYAATESAALSLGIKPLLQPATDGRSSGFIPVYKSAVGSGGKAPGRQPAAVALPRRRGGGTGRGLRSTLWLTTRR